MRAPQYGKVKPSLAKGPNPEAAIGLRVKPFANIFALVEGLGVVSLHQTEADAKTKPTRKRRSREKSSAAHRLTNG